MGESEGNERVKRQERLRCSACRKKRAAGLRRPSVRRQKVNKARQVWLNPAAEDRLGHVQEQSARIRQTGGYHQTNEAQATARPHRAKTAKPAIIVKKKKRRSRSHRCQCYLQWSCPNGSKAFKRVRRENPFAAYL